MTIGFISLVKPSGITSHDLVYQVRRITGIKQVGHSGTLDPMAQGVMIIGISKACKLIQYLASDKTYLAEILLGTATDTDDLEGKIIAQSDPFEVSKITQSDIGLRLQNFVGSIEQIPPAYSAIKIGGVKMYEMARKGQVLAPEAVKPRSVRVFSIETINFENPVLQVRISCSSGTYIRSIARDLGQELGIKACLKSLVRERIGALHLHDSLTVDQFRQMWQSDNTGKSCIKSGSQALDVPLNEMNNENILRLVNGQTLDADAIYSTDERGLFVAQNGQEEICLVQVQDGKMKAQVVLVSAGQLPFER